MQNTRGAEFCLVAGRPRGRRLALLSSNCFGCLQSSHASPFTKLFNFCSLLFSPFVADCSAPKHDSATRKAAEKLRFLAVSVCRSLHVLHGEARGACAKVLSRTIISVKPFARSPSAQRDGALRSMTQKTLDSYAYVLVLVICFPGGAKRDQQTGKKERRGSWHDHYHRCIVPYLIIICLRKSAQFTSSSAD